MSSPFPHRAAAGRLLAAELEAYSKNRHAIVLALPRGGVPVGFEVARALQLPLDVLVVRKVGVPGHPELAMGAVGAGGVVVRNERVIDSFQVTAADLGAAVRRERAELGRRERVYRGDCPPLAVAGQTVILVDDGIATGLTMRAALQVLQAAGPAAVIVAAPVIAADTAEEMRRLANAVIAVLTPANLNAIGQFYSDFTPTREDEVQSLLAAGRALSGRATTAVPVLDPRRSTPVAPLHALKNTPLPLGG